MILIAHKNDAISYLAHEICKIYYSANNSAEKKLLQVHAFQIWSNSRCTSVTSFCSNFVMKVHETVSNSDKFHIHTQSQATTSTSHANKLSASEMWTC